MKRRPFALFFFRIIPKAFLSRIFGRFARCGISKLYINRYIKQFKVEKSEIDFPEDGFNSLDHFFTRKLLAGVHKIDPLKNALVSPVDARIDQFGDITGTRILQAKGIDFLLANLVPADIHHLFIDGSFMTLYLSPADYHRIHSPVDGRVSGSLYVPGKLFSVQEFVVNGIRGLFTKNERVISYIDTSYGKCVVVKVGAMNVGRITLSYENIVTNNKVFRKKTEILYPENMRPEVKKGTELGQFHLGSTVIMLFEKDMVEFDRFSIGTKVRMGDKLGVLNQKSS